MEYSGDKRALIGNARFLLDYACQCKHLVPAAERLPHGTCRVGHKLVAHLQVRCHHLLEYRLLVRVDGEGVGVGQQVAFQRVRVYSQAAGELRVLDQVVPALLVKFGEDLLYIGGHFPRGPTFGYGHPAYRGLAAPDDARNFVEGLVRGYLEPAGLRGGRVKLAPDLVGQFVVPDSLLAEDAENVPGGTPLGYVYEHGFAVFGGLGQPIFHLEGEKGTGEG